MSKLKVLCLNSLTDGPALSLSGSKAMLAALTNLLRGKGLLERVDLGNCNVKELSSDDDFKKRMMNADVVIAHPDVFQYCPSVLFSSELSLKLLQIIYAGCNQLLKALADNNATLPYPVARMGGSFGPHMAEYVVGQVIGFERHFPKIIGKQIADRDNLWNIRDLGYRRLRDLTIGILGLGDIGREIAKYCKFLGMTVWGMTRTPVPKEKRLSCVDQYRQLGELEELLSASDYVCNVLPSTPETAGLLDKDGFKSCAEKKPVFINIGRGDIVKESTIVEAIKNKWLSGAALDVFNEEPLPLTSELWGLDNVVITPHMAALTMTDELAELVCEQIERCLSGKPLLYMIDVKRGY
ncbi:PREDICTED: uncharacterized protein LOC100637533 [Amphimedon queenslandica]|uniref:D-isomer specific 2-hydroxyacid dehydrogenase NAD-binding domain-containing protein n=1 Tax=Amphimedon queenslandica TaxID=400682 RepID=A0A1X7VLC4_AMPQE|nr:PREDICTED: uncharacterized protein LOC100637533 [Amphimedon queenslandica]|eukprot:XP_019862830.1 PREDICTED: uncharacterized protein LOC100637533 [Amphimedon queenslandica]